MTAPDHTASLTAELDELRRKLASSERIRENADFHLGQEMARRQIAEKETARPQAELAALAAMPPVLRAAVLREAADVAARFNSDCQNCAVELEVATELRRMAAEEAEALLDAYRVAVLAAAPAVSPPVSRAAVLREAADRLWSLANRTTERGAGVLWAADLLRRMADEEQPAATAAPAGTEETR